MWSSHPCSAVTRLCKRAWRSSVASSSSPRFGAPKVLLLSATASRNGLFRTSPADSSRGSRSSSPCRGFGTSSADAAGRRDGYPPGLVLTNEYISAEVGAALQQDADAVVLAAGMASSASNRKLAAIQPGQMSQYPAISALAHALYTSGMVPSAPNVGQVSCECRLQYTKAPDHRGPGPGSRNPGP